MKALAKLAVGVRGACRRQASRREGDRFLSIKRNLKMNATANILYLSIGLVVRHWDNYLRSERL